MAIEFKSVSEVSRDQGIKCLVHGEAGAGKTKLCSTTPKDERTLMVSAEAGLLSIKDEKHMSVVEVKSIEDVGDVYSHLQKNKDFDWVCLDSLSEIAEQTLQSELAATKDGRKAFGEMSQKIQALTKAFRDLRGVNVVFTAKLAKEKDEMTGSMLYSPGFPGKQLALQLPYFVDLVVALRVIPDQQTGELQRWLQTSQDQQWLAKDRSGLLSFWEEPNLAAIKSKIVAGSKKTPTKKAA